MPRLTRAQQTVRQQIQDLACLALLPGELGARMLQALHAAIPGDSRMLVGVDPVTHLFTHVIAIDQPSAAQFVDWLGYTYLVHEPGTLRLYDALQLASTPFVISDCAETSWNAPHALLDCLSDREYYGDYHEMGAPAGGHLLTTFAPRGETIAVLGFLRWTSASAFQPGDVAFLRLVAPTMGQALLAAFDRERAAMTTDAPGRDDPGVLVLTATGHIQLSTPTAEAWMDILRRSDSLKWGQLPTAVLTACARLRSGRDGSIANPFRIQTAAGLLRIEAARSCTDDTVVVVLTPERPPEPLRLPPSWPITSRERDVVELLVRGLSNIQIAATLVVTENTVETHLGRLYEKLEVHSRTELLARLFREVHWPTLRDGTAGAPW